MNDANTVTIEITGEPQSGKTTVAAIIRKALVDHQIANADILTVNQDGDLFQREKEIEENGVVLKRPITIVISDIHANPASVYASV